ncbi:MAG: FkbM family methyltransferase [Methanocorpusculum sp.]|nr:FkbM family methyltransferase [Methanocorpusculum sp.]MDE2523074.1 FkbM family methyltransferase [Methanocorpusculum sp.]
MNIMGFSGKTLRLTAVLALICIAATLSAGCIGVANPTPNQAMVRENLIFLDPDYVDANFIWILLLDPNSFDRELVNAVNGWLTPANPVIELGAGVGMLSTYINDRLAIPAQQVSVEPNPYLLPSLEKTKSYNLAGYTIVPKAVAYGTQNVTISTSSDIMDNRITQSSAFVETTTVPATTVRQIASNANFHGNITLVMNIIGSEFDVVLNEAEFLKNNVSTIISAVYTSGKNTPDSFAERLGWLGFTEMSRVEDIDGGYTVMVFEKTA